MSYARDLLGSVIGAQLTLEERIEKTIELAGSILSESNKRLTKEEKKRYGELHRMMSDPVGKVFLTSMTDQCFRTKNYKRIADQIVYLLHLYGIPKFFSHFKRLQLYLFKVFGNQFAKILVPAQLYLAILSNVKKDICKYFSNVECRMSSMV